MKVSAGAFFESLADQKQHGPHFSVKETNSRLCSSAQPQACEGVASACPLDFKDSIVCAAICCIPCQVRPCSFPICKMITTVAEFDGDVSFLMSHKSWSPGRFSCISCSMPYCLRGVSPSWMGELTLLQGMLLVRDAQGKTFRIHTIS